MRRFALVPALLTVAVAVAGSLLLASPASAGSSTDASYESKVIALTNTYRAKNGCGKVKANSKLTTAARRHSADMAKNNYFSHTSLTGSTFVTRTVAAGYKAATGENIAWGYKTPDTVTNSWINSAGHRANILNCKAKSIGVGLARKSDGTPYWTQIFGSA